MIERRTIRAGIVLWVSVLVWAGAICAQSAGGSDPDVAADAPDSLTGAPQVLPVMVDSVGPVHPCRLAGGDPLRSKTVADEERILRLSSLSPGEAVFLEPGTDLAVLGSFGLPQLMSLRSAGPNEVAYLIDGTPVSDPFFDVFDLNWLPLEGMAHVELTKGGNSAIYGNGSAGGALNLIPADALTDVPLSRFDAWWGSFGARSVGLSLRRPVASAFGILGAYENSRCGGWLDDSGYAGEKFYGMIAGSLGGQTVEVAAYRYRGEAGVPDSCPAAFDSGAGEQDDRRDLIEAAVCRNGTRPLGLKYYRLDVDRSTATTGRLEQLSGRVDCIELTAGLDSGGVYPASVRVGLKRTSMALTPAGRESSNDVYIVGRGDLYWSRPSLRWALRLERNSDYGTEMAPSLLARFNLRPGHLVFASLDRSYSFPSFLEIGCDTLLQESDPEPDTEHVTTLELGYALKAAGLSLEVCLYWRDAESMTTWLTDESCGSFVSTDSRSEVMGLEVSAGFSHPAGLAATVAYAAARSVKEVRDNLDPQPPHILNWEFAAERDVSMHVSVGAGLAGRWVADRAVGDRFAPCTGAEACLSGARLPGYAWVLGYGYIEIEHARVYTRVRNVFDDKIYSRWGQPSLPPRSYEIGVSWELRD